MKNNQQDSLYRKQLTDILDFSFDDRVAAVFPDMISRSVPGYHTVIFNIGIMAGRYAQANSNCYDLGCSLGASSMAMRQHITQTNCKIFAIDNSPDMISRALTLMQQADKEEQGNIERAVEIEFECRDIVDVNIEKASVVIMNFTLQFIDLALRQKLISSIYQGLKPGGILILSEKLAFNDNQQAEFLNNAHHDFKRANGYSDLEISQKRTALERVLQPESLSCQQRRLEQAGFSFYSTWFQCYNFFSLVAIK